MAKSTVMVANIRRMGIFTRETLSKGIVVVWGHILIGHLMRNIREIGKITKEMVMVNVTTRMEIDTRDNGHLISEKGVEHFSIPTAQSTKATSRTISRIDAGL